MAETETKTRLVYFCEGGDCSEKGSVELHNTLKERLAEKDPEGNNRLRKYPCFGGCEHGTNVVLFPDRVFYSKVTDADLDEIEQHLLGQGPVVKRLCGMVEEDVEQITWDLLDTGY
jgi:(2Fe-2S) ferredoxin